MIKSSNSFLPVSVCFWYFITEFFKYTGKLKEFYIEHSYTHHLDWTINILLYLLYHIFIHLLISFTLSSIPTFQSKLRTSVQVPKTFQHAYPVCLHFFLFSFEVKLTYNETCKSLVYHWVSFDISCNCVS